MFTNNTLYFDVWDIIFIQKNWKQIMKSYKFRDMKSRWDTRNPAFQQSKKYDKYNLPFCLVNQK